MEDYSQYMRDEENKYDPEAAQLVITKRLSPTALGEKNDWVIMQDGVWVISDIKEKIISLKKIFEIVED